MEIIAILNLGDQMKKIKILAIFLLITIMTGCGDKTLSCTKEEDMEAGVATEKQVITFSNDKINLYEAEMSIKLNDDYKEYADLLLNSLEEPFSDFKDKKGIEYKTSKDDNRISVLLSGEYNKMDEDTKKSLGIAENYSFDKTKESLENDGYSCKQTP